MASAPVPANDGAALSERGGDRDVLDYDVLIAGAGLVGLSLAPALAAAGRSVALADRAAVISPPAPAGDADWDTRVYAISPGSVAFLSSLGVWQALPLDRIAPDESSARTDFVGTSGKRQASLPKPGRTRRPPWSPISAASARISAVLCNGSTTTAAFSRGCRCPGAVYRWSGRRLTRLRASCS